MKKVFAFAAFAALAAISGTVKAQTVPISLPIGNVAQIGENEPAHWGLGGLEMITVKHSDGGFTPEMRTQVYDARTVEILSRAQAPQLKASDIHVMNKDGHVYIAIRKYLLLEVKPQDAAGEGMSMERLASKWAWKISQVIPAIANVPSPFGV
jgi:hypothetical protein